MNALLDFIDSVWTRIKARRAAKAAADLQAGADIIAQAQREADEMAAAASPPPPLPVGVSPRG